MLYSGQSLPVRERMEQAHAYALKVFAQPGTWWRGEDRNNFVMEARLALDCELCRRRKEALSPYTVAGRHDHCGLLPDHIVEVIHRIRTDSGRISHKWFKEVTSDGLSMEEYIEVVSLVAASTIIDTFAESLGLPVHELSPAEEGGPTREYNPAVVNAGAWVPLTRVEQSPTDLGLPTAPNISRAMGIVPGAVENFFGTFRPHYQLANLDFALSRSQVEFIASRVSALNQCFY